MIGAWVVLITIISLAFLIPAIGYEKPGTAEDNTLSREMEH
jgi:hypothetical protein